MQNDDISITTEIHGTTYVCWRDRLLFEIQPREDGPPHLIMAAGKHVQISLEDLGGPLPDMVVAFADIHGNVCVSSDASHVPIKAMNMTLNQIVERLKELDFIDGDAS